MRSGFLDTNEASIGSSGSEGRVRRTDQCEARREITRQKSMPPEMANTKDCCHSPVVFSSSAPNVECNSKGKAETPYAFGINVSHTHLIRRGLGERAPYRATPKLAYLGRTSEQRHRHWQCPAAAPRAAVREERKLAHPAVTPEQQLHNNAQIDNKLRSAVAVMRGANCPRFEPYSRLTMARSTYAAI